MFTFTRSGGTNVALTVNFTVGGSASIGSYAIALWAMTRAPVASVAALRETSVLFASLLAGSVWVLRPWPPLQWLPGWCVGLLLFWALVEWVAWLWSPQRSA